MYQDSLSSDPESDPGSAAAGPPEGSSGTTDDASERAASLAETIAQAATTAEATDRPEAPDRPEATAENAPSERVDAANAVEHGSAVGSGNGGSRDQVHPFREELARAMQAAAERERLRIEASVDEDADAHVQKVRARAAAEASELKRLAEEDVAGIRDWAKSEIERIRGEADMRMGERRERLDQHLIQHATIIDGEIDRVSEAVEGYRHELDAFFARLSAERAPSEIARLADTVPAPPDFELIRAVARADAVDRLAELEKSEEAEAAAPSEVSIPSEVSAESAGGISVGETELVPVMDPALAARSVQAGSETPPSAELPPASLAAPTEGPSPVEPTVTAETSSAPASVEAAPAAAADMEAPVAAAEMAATVGEPASADERVEAPEPVATTAGSGPSTNDTNPAARFIRSLTTWGQSGDQGGHDQPK